MEFLKPLAPVIPVFILITVGFLFEIVSYFDLILQFEISSQRTVCEDLRRRTPDEDQAEVHAQRREEKYRVVFTAIHS